MLTALGPPSMLGLISYNEPVPAEWDTWVLQLHAAMRKANTTHCFIHSPRDGTVNQGDWNWLVGLDTFPDKSKFDPMTEVLTHFYDGFGTVKDGSFMSGGGVTSWTDAFSAGVVADLNAFKVKAMAKGYRIPLIEEIGLSRTVCADAGKTKALVDIVKGTGMPTQPWHDDGTWDCTDIVGGGTVLKPWLKAALAAV
jgi:hypothetical protein